jgi:hypothetical protein
LINSDFREILVCHSTDDANMIFFFNEPHIHKYYIIRCVINVLGLKIIL